ncbi:protein translocase subunit SecF [Patescibacteria group bacterium]
MQDIVVQLSGDHGILLKFEHIDKEKHALILNDFQKEYKGAKESRYETVGPTVSQDLTRKAFIAVGVASLGIILYLAFAFRKVTKPANPWKFGVCAVVALIHDSLFVLGMFALFGHFFDLEVNSLFITALLTVIGFSVHDTIVVFDRIRENLNKMDKPFEDVVEYSVGQTMVRSLATSFTTLLVLVAILLFGGATIRSFIFALSIGILIGVYSSIFLASPLIVVWKEKQE